MIIGLTHSGTEPGAPPRKLPTWSIVSSQIWHEIWLRSWASVMERKLTVSTEIKIISSNSIISLTGLWIQRLQFITLKDIHLKTKWKLLNSGIIEMILWNHSKVFHLVTKHFRIIFLKTVLSWGINRKWNLFALAIQSLLKIMS